MLSLGQIQHNTLLSTTLHTFKHSGGCIMLWVCLSSARTRKFLGDKKKHRAKQRQNPRGKPGSVCFPTDTRRPIHLSAWQQPKTQGQIYTGFAYQDNIECSWVAELQFWLKSAWKSMARLENGCLEIINHQLDRACRIILTNIVQSRCANLLETYPLKTHSCNHCQMLSIHSGILM